MLLFHGSNVVVEFPEIRVNRYTKDFGWGFYCTNNFEQAKKWARRQTYVEGKAIVNCFEYTVNDTLKIKSFPAMSDEWLDFIAVCRKGQTHSYDIVEGPMADDQVWNYVEDFLNGTITRSAFWELAKFRKPTHQISFHSVNALLCLSFRNAEEV